MIEHMKTKVCILTALIYWIGVSCFAQEKVSRFGVELSIGPSLTLEKPGGASVSTGLGSDLILHYRFLPHLGVYTGWGFRCYSVDKSFVGDDIHFMETGYRLGIQFTHPIGQLPVSCYVRAGGLYSHIEAETDEDIIADTHHGPGWQLGAGLDFSLGSAWSLTPGVLMNHFSKDMKYSGLATPVDLRELSISVGLLKRF